MKYPNSYTINPPFLFQYIGLIRYETRTPKKTLYGKKNIVSSEYVHKRSNPLIHCLNNMPWPWNIIFISIPISLYPHLHSYLYAIHPTFFMVLPGFILFNFPKSKANVSQLWSGLDGPDGRWVKRRADWCSTMGWLIDVDTMGIRYQKSST